MNRIPAEMPAAAGILDGLSPAARALLRGFTLQEEMDSTNSFISRIPPDHRHGHAAMALRQSSGRGRGEHRWHSPPGGNLYLSLGWRFEAGTPELSTLPLLVAVCLARALADVGLRGHGVKWPNDILVGGRKLAGVLVESQSAGGERFVAIIGVGVNIRMPDDSAAAAIDRPWTDLSRELGPGMGSEPDANAMAVALLERLLPGLKTFESEGFASFREDWARFDLLSERLVRLTAKGEVSQGVAQGIDRFGSLLVETADGRVRAFHHGEASIVRD